MRPFDPRLPRHARAAAWSLLTTVALGLAATALVLAQASLLAHALAAAARGTGVSATIVPLSALTPVPRAAAARACASRLAWASTRAVAALSLIHISEPTRPY